MALHVRVEDLHGAVAAERGRERLRLVQHRHPHRQHVLERLDEGGSVAVVLMEEKRMILQSKINLFLFLPDLSALQPS